MDLIYHANLASPDPGRTRHIHTVLHPHPSVPCAVSPLKVMAAITRPPIAPPMPSISAAVQSPLQPSSDQVSLPFCSDVLIFTHSVRLLCCKVVVLYVVRNLSAHYPTLHQSPLNNSDGCNGSDHIRLLECTRHSELHKPSEAVHHRLA